MGRHQTTCLALVATLLFACSDSSDGGGGGGSSGTGGIGGAGGAGGGGGAPPTDCEDGEPSEDCGEYVPPSLRLVPHGEFLRGETVQIEVIAVSGDGNEEVLEEGLTFHSSDERVATVDETGLVTVHAGGPVTITVTASLDSMGEPLEASLEARATCEYPEFSRQIGDGKVFPRLAWPARSFTFATLVRDPGGILC